MPQTPIIYATSNPGKIREVIPHFASRHIKVVSLRDLDLADLDVEETGTSLGENAAIKTVAYAEILRLRNDFRNRRIIVVSDDTGLEIDGLSGQPGIHVRRWRDKATRMEDEEIIDYALEQMKDLIGEERAAQFRCVLAAVVVDSGGSIGQPQFFEGTLKGHILEQPGPKRREGFPFTSLFYVDEWNMLSGEAEELPPDEKANHLSHRERAIDEAVPYLRQVM